MKRKKIIGVLLITLIIVTSILFLKSAKNLTFADRTSNKEGEISHLTEELLDNEKNKVSEVPVVIKETESDEINGEYLSQSKDVYLTFDDGPDKVSTPLILDILDSHGIKGTFFVIGKHIEEHKELLQEIDARGHYVANHTYSHSYKKIYASDSAFIQDIRKNEDLINSLIGKKPKVIRDPGGKLLHKYESSLHKELVKIGYNRLEWTIDSFDSRSPVPSSKKIIENVKKMLNKEPLNHETVILFHDTRKHLNTVEALPEIIRHLKQQGFQFKIPKE